MNVVVDLQSVSVRRGPKTILRKITWRVENGERWVLLGANGAGKTTLLQVMAARMHPSEGTATILGNQLGRVDVFGLRPRIGLASAALADRFPRTEVALDVVRTALSGSTGRWRESYDEAETERALRLLEEFGVKDVAARPFGTLSTGEKTRVQIARALMTDPELLLLDEPGAGLDLGGRERLVAALAELASDPNRPALVFVTHHVEEIPPGFTHLALLRAGRLDAAGPIAETLTGPALSKAFEMPISVQHVAGRWSARATSLGAFPG
jgi:iron complex transport system ATP-binding protein